LDLCWRIRIFSESIFPWWIFERPFFSFVVKKFLTFISSNQGIIVSVLFKLLAISHWSNSLTILRVVFYLKWNEWRLASNWTCTFWFYKIGISLESLYTGLKYETYCCLTTGLWDDQCATYVAWSLYSQTFQHLKVCYRFFYFPWEFLRIPLSSKQYLDF